MSKRKPEVPVFVAPGHFYSPIADPAATSRYFASPHFAAQTKRVDAMLDMDAMIAYWHRFAPHITTFPLEKTPDFRYYGRNGQFHYFDASVLSGLLTELNPARIIEIGAGFSSACIFDTIDRAAAPRLKKFTTIDPDLSRINSLSPPPMAELLDVEVQSLPVEFFQQLNAGDVLFIDSSHVLKTGSDVHYEYLHILPALKRGVIVHIHDIFYPFEYSNRWAVTENRSWNEAYMVDMLLTHGNKFEVLFFNDAFIQKAADRVRAVDDVFDRYSGQDARPMYRVNGSLWLKKR
jgi:predicted O-methyltransferase YrrM